MKYFKFIIIAFLILQGCAFASQFTAQDLEEWYYYNTEYITDEAQFYYWEYYQSPTEFQDNKRGDCEDTSIHSNAILKVLGYRTSMYTTYFKEGAHAVTVFLDGGYYSIFSNGVILKTKEIDPVKAVEKIYPDWKMICKFKPTKYGKINIWNSLMSSSIIKWRFSFLIKE